jgi:sulfur relay (sulfurtransferase) DsrF/TusC family protein|tara:strand:+ start:4904 stop:5314 length:411 start_codon:yes stop_codon:yes gene_type:complete
VNKIKLSILFIVQNPPYKSENSKLAMTHALAGPLTELHIDKEVKTAVAFVGNGVLNCIKNQKSMDHWDITSNEQHLKNLLLSEVPIYVCKEDLEKRGINKDKLVDAKDLGGDESINIVSFTEIQNEIENASDLLLF